MRKPLLRPHPIGSEGLPRFEGIETIGSWHNASPRSGSEGLPRFEGIETFNALSGVLPIF